MKLYQGDCLEIMKQIPDKSVDMICCDLPYGTTACKWDNVIPFEPLWEQYNRVIKDNGAICLFGSEPFSSMLRCSNLKMFKYDWIWRKNKLGNFLNCKNSPLKEYEIISIFSKGSIANCSNNMMVYNPQGLKECSKKVKSVNRDDTRTIGHRKSRDLGYIQTQTGYPRNILEHFDCEKHYIHPTQKPIPLMEYLIKTYTNEGDLVLDNCMGSGTCGIACKHLNRDFIGIELDEKYFQIAKDRIEGELL